MHGERLSVSQVEEGRGEGARLETEVAFSLRPYEIALVEAP